MASLEASVMVLEVTLPAGSRLGPDPADLNTLAAPKWFFSHIVAQTKAFQKMDLPIKPPTFMDASEPAVFFSQDEIDASCRPFIYFTITKCSYGRPSILKVKQIMSSRFQLKTDFFISILDPFL